MGSGWVYGIVERESSGGEEVVVSYRAVAVEGGGDGLVILRVGEREGRGGVFFWRGGGGGEWMIA